jgi:cell division protein FtsB
MSDARRARSRAGEATRTRRVVVLVALGVLCALVLAPPLRLYVQQQQDIAALQEEIAQREADVARLDDEVALWDDDAYVAAQARERLNFVMPGETGYVVPDPEPAPGTAAGASEDGLVRPDAAPEGTWYDRLWSSVEATGTGGVDPVLDAPHVTEDPTGDPVGEPSADPSDG